MEEFHKVRRLPPYVFEQVNRLKASARSRGADIIDLGMGNPDGAPPRHVIEKLAEVAAKPTAHRYSASKGIPGLRKAQAAYYRRRFGVELDPDRERLVMRVRGLPLLAFALVRLGEKLPDRAGTMADNRRLFHEADRLRPIVDAQPGG